MLIKDLWMSLDAIRFDYRLKCFVLGRRPLKGAHTVIRQWYCGGRHYDQQKAKKGARLDNPNAAVIELMNDLRPTGRQVGAQRGSVVDLQLAKWASGGAIPTNKLALKAVRMLTANGWRPFKGKHGVRSRCGSVYTEIDFVLVNREGVKVAVELKTGYDIEFYQPIGKMTGCLSNIDYSMFHHASLQATIGWYLHQSRSDTNRQFTINGAAVLHLSDDTCTIRMVPDWCGQVLMTDLRYRFEEKKTENARKARERKERVAVKKAAKADKVMEKAGKVDKAGKATEKPKKTTVKMAKKLKK